MSIKKWIVALVMVGAFSLPAHAADLGGGCCADLEERVAELEATAARKGNRKMSLTVYGQVNYALLHLDAADLAKDTTLTNNPNSQSRIGFKGEAKISNVMKAGFLVEIGIGAAEPVVELGLVSASTSNGRLNNDLVVRHSALYMEHANLGAVWVGRTSTATDGISEISLARTGNASTLLSLEPVSGAWLGGANMPFDGGRTDVIKYVSPTLAGFVMSAAWAVNVGDEFDAWDIALRYAGEFGGVRLAAGVGYRVEQVSWGIGPFFSIADETKTLTGSASIMHVVSGLFANVAAGQQDGLASTGTILSIPLLDISTGLPLVDMKAVHVQAGIERNWFGFGDTTMFAEWGRMEDKFLLNGGVDFWGVGFNQAIDAAAMDLYAGYRNYDDLDSKAFVAGAIIRF